MKIINFAQRLIPIYSREATLHFLPQYYFWAKLGHYPFTDMLQFWLSLWLNPKVFTCQKVIKPQIGRTVKTVRIDTNFVLAELNQVHDSFYERYGEQPAYYVMGTRKYQALYQYAGLKFTDLGIKVLLTPHIEGIVALPDLKRVNWKEI